MASIFSRIIDGELPELERLRVQRHLSTCARCTAEHDSLAAAWGHVAALPRVGPRTDLWPRLAARLSEPKPRAAWPWLVWRPSAALAAATLVIGLILGMRLGDSVLGTPTPPTRAALAQNESLYFGDIFPGSLADVVLSRPVESPDPSRTGQTR